MVRVLTVPRIPFQRKKVPKDSQFWQGYGVRLHGDEEEITFDCGLCDMVVTVLVRNGIIVGADYIAKAYGFNEGDVLDERRARHYHAAHGLIGGFFRLKQGFGIQP